MKTLIVIFLLFVSTNLFSQIDPVVTTGTAIGIEFDAVDTNITEVQGTFSVSTTLKVGEIFDISAIMLTIINAEVPKFLAGSQVGVKVWESDNKATSLGFVAGWLYGSGGQQYIRGGTKYGIDKTSVLGTVDWNYKMKNVLALIGVTYDIIPASKPNRNLSHKLKIKEKINKFLTHKLKQERI